MLGTFLLMGEKINEYGFVKPQGVVSVSVDSDHPLKIIAAGSSVDESAFEIYWDALTGREYNLYSTTNLCSPFRLMKSGMVYPQNSYFDSGISSNQAVFYMLEAVE